MTDLLKKQLACSLPCPYSFAASETFRLQAFKLDRAQVRRWALAHKLAHAVPPKNLAKVMLKVKGAGRAMSGATARPPVHGTEIEFSPLTAVVLPHVPNSRHETKSTGSASTERR